jgi:S-methylmethionine-dependent homocysteine/selenocysteine methylase
MAKYRSQLPQLEGGLFLTDGGIETTLVYHDGLELPHFAAFHLLGSDDGSAALRRYHRSHAEIAAAHGTSFVPESATWRASPDWLAKLGYPDDALARVNGEAIRLLETSRSPMPISGCVGPRGDGYDPGRVMTAEDAQAYHAPQVGVFAASAADLVSAITMTNVPEAIGVARAARAEGMPVVISFTVETDGRLPTG